MRIENHKIHKRQNVSNHKCRLHYDENGNTIKEPIVVEYDMMSSGKKIQHDNFTYLGYGDCVSVFNNDIKKECRIDGAGHFWKRNKQ